MSKYNEGTSMKMADVKKLSVFVRCTLSRVDWKIPVFRPTLKCHKTPIKIRPVISKRRTANTQVGKVICSAFSKIM